MSESSKPWTKFDPLTINIFRIYSFGNLDIIKFVAFRINLKINVIPTIPEVKNHLILPAISILQKKFEKFGEIWVPLVDVGYL